MYFLDSAYAQTHVHRWICILYVGGCRNTQRERLKFKNSIYTVVEAKFKICAAVQRLEIQVKVDVIVTVSFTEQSGQTGNLGCLCWGVEDNSISFGKS